MSKQPEPVKNNLPALWDLVIEDMKQRDQLGMQNYGTRLQPFNGRNSLKDLSEELLDGTVYLKQLQWEIAEISNQIMSLCNDLKINSDYNQENYLKEELTEISKKLNSFL